MISQIELSVKKHDKPVIFVDGNFFVAYIRATKEPEASNRECAKIISVYELLRSLCNSEKVLCPIGTQHREIAQGVKKKSNVDYIMELSKGVRFFPTEEIINNQKRAGYEAYIAQQKKIELSHRIIIDVPDDNDCLAELSQRIAYKIGLPQELVNSIQDVKRQIQHETEELKRDLTSTPLNELYQREIRSEACAFWRAVEKINNGTSLDTYETNVYRSFLKIVEIEDDFYLYADQAANYMRFLLSDYFAKLPINDIECRLFAHRFRAYDPKRGDLIDFINAANYLPFCTHYLTDKAMVNSISAIGADEMYSVKLFSISSIDAFLHELLSLSV